MNGSGQPQGDHASLRRAKTSAAAVSVVSNTLLIGLKIVAGAVTGSIAIVTEAIHSAIDLIASFVAYASVRKSDQPPDAEHPFGHGKIENLAATVEAMLLVVGAGIILYESTRRLIGEPVVEYLGIGIAVMALSLVANLAVSEFLYRRARSTHSEALAADAAHLRADAATSAVVLVGLIVVELTGWVKIDAAMAIVVSFAIVLAAIRIFSESSRVLVDESLPEEELAAVREVVDANAARELLGFHRLRARGGRAWRHVDLHVQFADDTPLMRAHEIAHELEDGIRDRLGRVDVMIHIEPESESALGEE
jgi:cation diffusion facilitator family transporter